MNSWLNKNPFFNDNQTIIRLNTFFRFFSLGYYNVHVIFINFISFTGIFCLYKTFSAYCPEKKKELFIFTFLMPSVLFWGSGVLKDGILISGFGIMLYSYMLLMKKGTSIKRFISFLIALLILLLTKVYVIAIILPGLLAWWITVKKRINKALIPFLAIYSLYLIISFSLYRINPDYNIAAMIFYKQKNFMDLGNIHHASMISVPYFECSAPSILKSTPQAFFNSMFRPFLTDVHGNPMILLAALENLLIILMVIVSIFSFKTHKKKMDPFVLFCMIFTILLFILVGLITPVLGAIVRYRIVALPCLVFVLIYYYDRAKLYKNLSFLSKKRKNLDA